MLSVSLRDRLCDKIPVIPDFPKPGVNFRDMGPLLADPFLWKETIQAMGLHLKHQFPDTKFVAGIDARGFLLGIALAEYLECPFVMIRKQGKTPGEVYSQEYECEYKTDCLVLSKDVGISGSGILVDDIVATGGTARAAVQLLEQAGVEVLAIVCLIQLYHETWKDLSKEYIVFSALRYHAESTCQQMVDPDRFLCLRPVPYSEVNFGKRTNATSMKNDQIIVFGHPDASYLVDKIVRQNKIFRKGWCQFRSFPDGTPEIFFEPVKYLENQSIVMVLSLLDLSSILAQYSLLLALCRQGIKSMNILLPFNPTGTNERVSCEGQVATAETFLHMISNLPATKTGPPTLDIFDIHAPIARFYSLDNVRVRFHSMMKSLREYVQEMISDKRHLTSIDGIVSNSGGMSGPACDTTRKNSDIYLKKIICFPDEGAYKRYGPDFSGVPTLVLSKRRSSRPEERIISPQFDLMNVPPEINQENVFSSYSNVVIVDDIIQSGGTLIETGKMLKSCGAKELMVVAVHGVFPRKSYNRLRECGLFDRFIICDTVPKHVPCLEEYNDFKIVSIVPQYTQYLSEYLDRPFICEGQTRFSKVLVSSINPTKLRACHEFFQELELVSTVEIYGLPVPSGVNEQPINEETEKGCENRHENLSMYMNQWPSYRFDYLVSLENGLFDSTGVNGKQWRDRAFGIVTRPTAYFKRKGLSSTVYSPIVPLECIAKFEEIAGVSLEDPDLYDKERKNGTITIGNIMEHTFGVGKEKWYPLHNDGTTRKKQLEYLLESIYWSRWIYQSQTRK